jgi:HAD superfamily hydrolase (TIGR01509 family)
MGSPIELVIFDCDGVLVDSETVAVHVNQRVLADLGWNLTIEEIVDRFVGGTRENFDGQIEEFLGRSLDPAWAEPYAPWYRQAFDNELKAVEGIGCALEHLAIPSCVASNSSHDRVRYSLTLTGLIDRFEGRIFSADDVEHGKPAPDLFEFASSSLGVDPSRCLVIEDSRFGVDAARAAGMRVLGYAGGLTPAVWLERRGATVFTAMDDLEGLIGALSVDES